MRFFVGVLAGAMVFCGHAVWGQTTQAASAPVEISEREGAVTEMLKVGDLAPEFEVDFPAAQADAGQTKLSLKEFRGKKNVLLAFYPKASTPGCTSQMCGYRDDWSMFQNNETVAIAISTDKQEASDKFQKKHNLPMVVLGDPERKIIRAYGVPVKKLFNTAQRSVVLIDKQGIVRYVDYEYSIKKDQAPLYEKIKELSDEQEG